MYKIKATTCDWCLQEAPVQVIEEKLFRFWGIISNEDPTIASHKNICAKCKSCYEDFSVHISSCKTNESIIEKILSSKNVKKEPSIDIEIEYHPLIKKEIFNDEEPDSKYSAVSNEQQNLPGCSYFPDTDNTEGLKEEIKEEILNEKEPGSNYPAVSSKVGIEQQNLPSCSNFLDADNRIIAKSSKEKVKEATLKEEDPGPDYPAASSEKGIEHQNLPGRSKIAKSSKKKVKESTLNEEGPGPDYPAASSEMSIEHQNLPGCSNDLTTDNTIIAKGLKEKVTHLVSPSPIDEQKREILEHQVLPDPNKLKTPIKPFTCITVVRNDRKRVKPEKNFRCLYCNKAYAQSQSLKTHMLTHKQRVECPICNSTFASSNNLKRHMHLHTAEELFECPQCNKTFLLSKYLQSHMRRVHTKKKSYKCPTCNKVYSYSTTLKNHMRSHARAKRVKCPICDSTLASSSYLKRHLRIHTQKQFKCNLCDKTYTLYMNLHHHLRVCHNIHVIPKEK